MTQTLDQLMQLSDRQLAHDLNRYLDSQDSRLSDRKREQVREEAEKEHRALLTEHISEFADAIDHGMVTLWDHPEHDRTGVQRKAMEALHSIWNRGRVVGCMAPTALTEDEMALFRWMDAEIAKACEREADNAEDMAEQDDPRDSYDEDRADAIRRGEE